MSEMIWRSVRAADVAGDLYLASLPTRLASRPEGWRHELAAVRMRAALSAALDLTEAERLALYDADDNIGSRIFNRGVDAALAALRSLSTDQVQAAKVGGGGEKT